MYVRAGRPAFARPYVGVHKLIQNNAEFIFMEKILKKKRKKYFAF